MAVCKLQYYQSYFSIYSTSVSTATAGSSDDSGYFNPFDINEYPATPDPFSSGFISTDDISYDSNTGRITFTEGGKYMVVFTPSLTLGNGASQSGVVEIEFRVNGSDVFSTEGTNYYHNTSLVPRQHVLTKFIDVNNGDYLEVFNKTATATRTLANNTGTSLAVFRISGEHGEILYTGDGDTVAGSTSVVIGTNITSSNVTVSKSDDLSYLAANGFTVPDTKKYYMFSALSVDSDASEVGVDVDMLRTGSEINDSTLSVRNGSDPYTLANSLIAEFQASEYGATRTSVAPTSGNYTLKKGTCFNFLDITNKGTDVGALLSLTCDSDSNGLSSAGDYNCFDASNWPSGVMPLTENIATTNVSHTTGNGRFTFTSIGKYMVSCHLVVDRLNSGTATVSFYIKKNGTKIYDLDVSLNQNWTPRDVSFNLIIDVTGVTDYFEFGLFGLSATTYAGYKAGSTISIFKVDDLTHAIPRLVDDRGLVLTAETTPQAQIADDFDLKTFDIDTLTPQRSRLTDQVPFILGVPGPLSLRGRCFGGTEEPPIVKPGDKKN
jgi:hypothetical protein